MELWLSSTPRPVGISRGPWRPEQPCPCPRHSDLRPFFPIKVSQRTDASRARQKSPPGIEALAPLGKHLRSPCPRLRTGGGWITWPQGQRCHLNNWAASVEQRHLTRAPDRPQDSGVSTCHYGKAEGDEEKDAGKPSPGPQVNRLQVLPFQCILNSLCHSWMAIKTSREASRLRFGKSSSKRNRRDPGGCCRVASRGSGGCDSGCPARPWVPRLCAPAALPWGSGRRCPPVLVEAAAV